MLLESYFEFAAETAIRLKGTRVGIEKVVEAYLAGASAEETVLRYPTLSLEQVHATLTYYLANRPMVDAYVSRVQQQKISDWEQSTLTVSPFVQSLRERLAQQRDLLHEAQISAG